MHIGLSILIIFCQSIFGENPKRFNEKYEVFQLRAYKNISELFTQKVVINIDRNYDQIILGNKKYGSFEVLNFLQENGNLSFYFIPPGYKYPLNIYGIYDNKKTLLKTLSIKRNFTPPRFIERPRFKGDFSFPFLAINQTLVNRSKINGLEMKFAPAITNFFNAYGEIIWSHLSLGGDPSTTTIVKKKDNNFIFGTATGGIEILTSLGKITETHYLSKSNQFPPHHDFIFDKQNKKVVYLSEKTELMKINFKNSISGILNTPYSKPKKVRTDILVEYDLRSQKHVVLWSPKKTLKEKALSLESFEERFRMLNFKEKILASDFHNYFQNNRSISWNHLNSLYSNEKGYLLSSRNTNQLIYIDKESLSTKWTIGSNQGDLKLSKEYCCIGGQHNAQFIGNNQILVFDNYGPYLFQSKKYSRILILEVTNQKTVNVKWEYITNQKLFARERGSVSMLDNGNILGYFPNSLSHDGNLFDVVIEVDRKSKKEVGKIYIDQNGYRVYPFYELGNLKFLN